LTAIGQPNGAADGHHSFRVIDKGLGGAQQGVGLQQRIGVDGAKKRAAGDINAGVKGVGLTAILFVYDQKAGMARRAPEPAYLVVRGFFFKQALGRL
jgi:hypothetical protein